MQIYRVGGHVRDLLMHITPRDTDYVVVGASVQDMLDKGFRPVGKDFPVFLNPKDTQEPRPQYALARTEKKVAPGYTGFLFHTDPSVTLEEDLARRDLTINAMAMDENNNIIDPFGGQEDIKNKVFRHVSPAFSEDPVRILRVARFAARYTDFTIAPETMKLMKDMVNSNEVNALVPERVWNELQTGLLEKKPSRMIQVLHDCGALARLLPEIESLWYVPQPERYHPEIYAHLHTMLALDYAAKQNYSLIVRFSVLLHDLGKGTSDPTQWPHHRAHEERGAALVEQVCRRLKVSNAIRNTAVMIAREHGNIRRILELRARTVVMLLERCDAFRRTDRFKYLLDATECDLRGRKSETRSCENIDYPQREYWLKTIEAIKSEVNPSSLIQSLDLETEDISYALHSARSEATANVLTKIKLAVLKQKEAEAKSAN